MSSRLPWKQNVLSLSPAIRQQVASLGTDDCVVAAVKRIPNARLASGQFSHLGISLDSGNIHLSQQVLPQPTVGRYSKYNIYGREIVFKDLPMVTKTYSVEAPNFGDFSNGSHEVSWGRDVYQREQRPPLFLSIEIECLAVDIRADAHALKFAVGRTLDRRDPHFEEDLLFDINLLQENVGDHHVYSSDASSEDFLKTLYINWEILPPGERDDNIARILTGINTTDPAIRARLVERYDFLVRLKPRNFVKGTSGFLRYFGAQFADDLVVFENVEYGNAAYVVGTVPGQSRHMQAVLGHLDRRSVPVFVARERIEERGHVACHLSIVGRCKVPTTDAVI